MIMYFIDPLLRARHPVGLASPGSRSREAILDTSLPVLSGAITTVRLVTTAETVDAERADAIAAARAGDSDAFRALVSPYLQSLHLHCYRMLGSYDDAEEAMQDAMLRAWRGLATFEGRAPLHHWLYRIATTTCLRAIERRGRAPVSVGEITHLQPYPDRLLEQITDVTLDPAAAVEQRETVTLAFVSALQRLPATQRAVLILRDVLVWTSAEVADLLQTSVPAVNSSLQRARTTMRASASRPTPVEPLSAREREVLDRFVRAWQDSDIQALADLLREDATLRMPPEIAAIIGRDRVTDFFATVPADGRLDLIHLVHTRANGEPALAAYLPDGDGPCRGYGLMVLTVVDDAVAEIVGFADPALFEHFGLPLTRPGS
jgi:RNA polymerase sigma-70 factor, ECF subfamily